MKNRLLIVGAFPPSDLKIVGGVATTCGALLDSSLSETFDLILVDSTQISNPPPPLQTRALIALKRFVRFIQLLLTERPDAVLLFASTGASFLEKGLMAWVSRTRSIPVFLFPRGGRLIDDVNASPLQKIWVKAMARGASHLLCQGPAWRRFATNVLGFEDSNAPIILNWSATTKLLEVGAGRTLSAGRDNPALLFLGWLENTKGIFDLLEVCREALTRYRFRLVIAGRGHAEAEARAFVTAHNLQGSIEFVGWVQGADKDALLEATDILVLPSWAEGFPNAIVEAMAAKVAVIATTVGNVPDLISDREEALLVPPRDRSALGRAIELLLKDLEFRKGLAERGHVFARENFSAEKGIAKLALTIEQAIDNKGNK